LDPSAIVVGMVGRLTRAKGYREYFEAARRIKNQKQDNNVIFVVAGEIDHTKGLGIPESEIHQLEEQGVIRYLGSLGHQEMARLYSIMDISVLMSHREGFPRCLVEAASMGKPIIATNIRGCREAVEHGVTGYLVKLSDNEALVHYLEHLISHQGLREELGRAGRRKALAEFDEVRLVDKILGVYENLFRSQVAL
jgi:glycosyltransferase involved in cell wall biosynthesis